MPTQVSYDKLGWTALLSVGWSMLAFTSVQHVQLGLSLLTHVRLVVIVSIIAGDV